MPFREYPLPPHYDPQKANQVWRVPYGTLAQKARDWAQTYNILPAAEDKIKFGLLLVDMQNTFCLPEFELYVGGRSGTGAIDDNRRLCEFIYRNLGTISEITVTLDTHTPMQIFHPTFLIDTNGEHPAPMTMISAEDIQSGKWKINPALLDSLGMDEESAQRYLQHYTRELQTRGKYELTIWPFHAMLGGIGQALVSCVEEAVFFHSIARYSQPDFVVKGEHQLTEHYSVIGPEVLEDPQGNPLAQKDTRFIEKLKSFNALAIAGQAKSHCLAWTVSDLLEDVRAVDASLACKIYLLEDCTSPVVVPGVVDYTQKAEEAFQHFAEAGMHIVRSTVSISDWPDFPITST